MSLVSSQHHFNNSLLSSPDTDETNSPDITEATLSSHRTQTRSTTPSLKKYPQITRLLRNILLIRKCERITTPPPRLPPPSTVFTLLRRDLVLSQNTFNASITRLAITAVAVEEWLNQLVRQCLCKMAVQTITTLKSSLTRMFL